MNKLNSPFSHRPKSEMYLVSTTQHIFISHLKILCLCTKTSGRRRQMILQLQGFYSAHCNVAVVTQAPKQHTHYKMNSWNEALSLLTMHHNSHVVLRNIVSRCIKK